MSFDLSRIDASWRRIMEPALATPAMVKLDQFLQVELSQGKVIYPAQVHWFKAFEMTPLATIKVVIVGQDPYHGAGQAHGLSFSVPESLALPPSLKNIFKEISGASAHSANGDLSAWAEQGVFLLNAALTVEEGKAGSHAKKGWLEFTESCLRAVNEQCSKVVFLAWGRFAHKLCAGVDQAKHVVIKTSHPSPLGAYKSGADFSAFLGSGCFEQANKQLSAWSKTPIRWRVGE
ncbi:uracil-DNA glycosylase [Simiduia curdlanivorans]|uniref:Uracil-DNA glycosylase n=1 Tax=Simiduia curdlanivorans TaxID=1492769 RepID=A0ABV8V7K4_9GAMM|nr:uracil-DNA glycosylase [Simiduia curdlanivorans]MDN3639789.1 uracil-DNA glycosylase [Simiduia curdlanivorans]